MFSLVSSISCHLSQEKMGSLLALLFGGFVLRCRPKQIIILPARWPVSTQENQRCQADDQKRRLAYTTLFTVQFVLDLVFIGINMGVRIHSFHSF